MSGSERLDHFPPPEGSPGPALEERLTQERIDAYAEASGDHNPIHLDPDFARAVGLPSTIAHGLLTMGAATAQLERWAESLAYVAKVTCRFSAPVPSGDVVTGHPLVIRSAPGLAQVEMEVLNGAGERALTKAEAELRGL